MKKKDRFILESFWQEDGFNCSSIALIKAALLLYGSRIFRKRTTEAGESIMVWLRNGKTVELTRKRIKKISEKNRIVFEEGVTKTENARINKLEEQVNLCFAVMVAYLVTHGKEKYTWGEARKQLADKGYYSDEVHELLGLRKRTRGKNPPLKKIDLVKPPSYPMIVYDRDHAVVAYKGYYDKYGKLKPLEKIRKLYGEIRGCYWYRV
jgi:hypothetical protein